MGTQKPVQRVGAVGVGVGVERPLRPQFRSWPWKELRAAWNQFEGEN